MVRKIQNTEYLRRYSNMPSDERKAYTERVGEWLKHGCRSLINRACDVDARFQNVLVVSMNWNDADCAAFEEGAILMSALQNTHDTWLPELLYVKAARRAIRQMAAILSAVPSVATLSRKGADTPVNLNPKEEPSVKNRKETEAVGTDSVSAGKPSETVTAVPPRPKHIDQYVHLLPAKTQERAAKVKDLLRELDYAREKARLLMGSPQASPDDMAAWAKKATACDNAVRSIYKELDAEWEKLVKSGRIEVDVFGNARVVADGGPSETVADQDNPELTSEQKHKRRELRKWLIDTRRGVSGKAREKRIGQWKENWNEYLTLESLDAALKDEKIVAAAAHFGIVLATAQSQHTNKETSLQERSDGQPTEQQ